MKKKTALRGKEVESGEKRARIGLAAHFLCERRKKKTALRGKQFDA
jgi:hypothetical protein